MHSAEKEEKQPFSWLLAIADDLTGALETGAAFADHGLGACVTTHSQMVKQPPDQSVYIINSETRHCSSAEAEQKLAMISQQAARFSPGLIYKKTDSTLRGNIHAELKGLSLSFPQHRILYAPAYPDMGRTVQDGQLLVHGTPVQETDFGKDRLNPVSSSDVRALLKGLPGSVLDGVVNDDVAKAAHEILHTSSVIAAGPAALAKALAAQMGIPSRQNAWQRIRRCLIFNGSLHPVSRDQIQWAQQNGVFDDDWKYFDPPLTGKGTARAREAGVEVYQQFHSQKFDGLIVFGGDTALGVHSAFGSHPFRPLGELLPGVPVSTDGNFTWITKAGGFGPPDVLREIKRLLT